VRALDPDVFVGRNPAWKEAWEEILSQGQRRQVRRAVMRGRSLDDSELAPFVMGLLAREKRSLRWKPVVLIAMSILWLFAGVVSRSSFNRWFYLCLATVVAIGGTASYFVQQTWLERAERLNLFRPRPDM
jgi:hypothetical protein